MSLPEVQMEGVLWLETESAGVISEACVRVLTVDPDIAEEVQRVADSETLRDLPWPEIDSLLVDIGMVLQFSRHLMGGSEAPKTAGKDAYVVLCNSQSSSKQVCEQLCQQMACFSEYCQISCQEPCSRRAMLHWRV